MYSRRPWTVGLTRELERSWVGGSGDGGIWVMEEFYVIFFEVSNSNTYINN